MWYTKVKSIFFSYHVLCSFSNSGREICLMSLVIFILSGKKFEKLLKKKIFLWSSKRLSLFIKSAKIKHKE